MSSGSRRIDFEITESNGPRSLEGMIETAKRTLDERIVTILCVDGSGSEAIVIRDEHGAVQVFEHLRGGEVDLAEAAAAIEAGIAPSILLACGTGDRIASLDLNADEMRAIDDGQEFWIATDGVELVLLDNGWATMIVTRRTDLPDPEKRSGEEWSWDHTYPDGTRTYEWDQWCELAALPTTLLLRMLREGYDQNCRVIGGAA
jgi:hypothetical protein